MPRRLLFILSLLTACAAPTAPKTTPPNAEVLFGTWNIEVVARNSIQGTPWMVGTITFPREDLNFTKNVASFYNVTSSMTRTDCTAADCWPAPAGKYAQGFWPIATFMAPDSVAFRDDNYSPSIGVGSYQFLGKTDGSVMSGQYFSRENGTLNGTWYATRATK